MKKILIVICCCFIAGVPLLSQTYESITVKAGTRLMSYFPYKERFMYADFLEGNVLFRNGRVSSHPMNYNFLLHEMQFIQAGDTLSITKSSKKDIRYITVGQDTFHVRDQYLKQIRSGKLRVFENEDIILKDILKKGAMGTINRSSASGSYSSITLTGNIYELRPEEDWVFQKTPKYLYSVDNSEFEIFTRKNVLQLIPSKEDGVKNFLKSNKIDFESREDVLKLADYLSGLF